MRLSIEDYKRIVYWYYKTFLNKEPPNGDKKTITKVDAILNYEQDQQNEWNHKFGE